MKIFAVDVRRESSGGAWRKNWTSLGLGPRQIVLAEQATVTIADESGPALVLLHTAVDDESVRDIANLVARSSGKYVLLVGQSGGVPPSGFNLNSVRIHISKVAFPNDVDLTHLKARLECLASDLVSSNSEAETKEAFRRFDDDALGEFLELASALALLPESQLLNARFLDRLRDANWCKAVAARVIGFGELRTALGVPETGTGTVLPDDVLAFVRNSTNLVALARCL